MSENKILKFACMIMLVTIVAVSMVSGTYAKYTSTANGSDSAVVAKWDIKAGAKNQEVSIVGSGATVAFNLFDTIKNSDGTTESNVTTGKIAPGTTGSFELSIKNSSDVTVRYGINYTVTSNNVPIKFSTDGGTTWTNTLANITPSNTTKIAINSSKSVIINWKWEFDAEGNDDTTIGKIAPTVTVAAQLTVEQVD